MQCLDDTLTILTGLEKSILSMSDQLVDRTGPPDGPPSWLYESVFGLVYLVCLLSLST